MRLNNVNMRNMCVASEWGQITDWHMSWEDVCFFCRTGNWSSPECFLVEKKKGRFEFVIKLFPLTVRPSLFFLPREYRLPSFGSGRKAGLVEGVEKKRHHISRLEHTDRQNELNRSAFTSFSYKSNTREIDNACPHAEKKSQLYVLCHMGRDLKNWICEERQGEM